MMKSVGTERLHATRLAALRRTAQDLAKLEHSMQRMESLSRTGLDLQALILLLRPRAFQLIFGGAALIRQSAQRYRLGDRHLVEAITAAPVFNTKLFISA